VQFLMLKREENMSKLERMRRAENSNTKELSSKEKRPKFYMKVTITFTIICFPTIFQQFLWKTEQH
jgi:hypothetical protein